jgi:two-component system, chemotaxis family, protein-glutamate methylesterase/glutaminase
VAKQEIVVIGASAGGVEALQIVVAGLPVDFAAAVFIVLHIGAGIDGRSLLPEILTKAGPLSAVHPADGDEIQRGRIYLAKPDCHLMLADGRIRVVYGPKENRARPAINPLFRSAAAAYAAGVTGVVLTGLLDDGVAGLAEIKRRGGIAVVQDPATALFSSMPRSAIEHVDVDYIVPLQQIPGLLSDLATRDRDANEVAEAMERTLLEIKCPECSGPMWEEKQGRIVEYRCRVGHAYSPIALREEEEDAVEKALWHSIITLENAALIAAKLHSELGPEYTDDAELKYAQAKTIRQMLKRTGLPQGL